MTMTQNDAMDTERHTAEPDPATVQPTRAAWELIDEARHARLTGELSLITALSGTITIYLNSGVVYLAERDTDEPLAARLVMAGAITPDQLDRGIVRLNGVDYLGRLFDRDTTVLRDVVELVLELMTEQSLTEIAQLQVLASSITMYRHHPSGVVRWSVPVASAAAEPAGAVPASPWEPPSPTASVPARSDNVVDVDPASLLQPLPTLPPKPAAYTGHILPVVAPLVEPAVVTPPAQPAALEQRPAEPAPAPLPPLASISTTQSFVPIKPITASNPVVPATDTAPLFVSMISAPVQVVTPIIEQPTRDSVEPASDSDNDSDSIPVPIDVAAAVRDAIAAIEAATQSALGGAGVNFGPVHVTAPGSADRPTMADLMATTAAAGPVIAAQPNAQSDARQPLSDSRKGALRRLINGVRRR